MLDLIKTMLMKKEIEKQVGKSAYEKPMLGLVDLELKDGILQASERYWMDGRVEVEGGQGGYSAFKHELEEVVDDNSGWSNWPY